jgi:cytosine/adenosine deaminase-related metal-dependent hydrolase
MKYVSGEILKQTGFEKGYIGFENKLIIETGKGNPPEKPIFKGLILPSFVNAHTHIGDSFIKQKKVVLPKNIEKLVAPPNGLKHRLLQKSTDEEIIDGMEKSIDIMIKNGIKYFCDFRENGILGISQLKAALQLWKISCIILSRPDTFKYDKNELDLLLKNSNGIALSSITDWNFSEIKKIARDTKNKNKIFSLHASERIREKIDDILDLKPDFLVHMIKATESDLLKIKEMNIPIVICPRANSFFKMKPDYELLKKVKVELCIGTDNAMLNFPSVLDEIKYIYSTSKEFSLDELFYFVTYGARKALNLDCAILGPNSKADFVVLNKKSLKPLFVSGK